MLRSWFELLANVEQLSAELVAVAEPNGAAELIDADVDQLADALTLLSLTSGEGAGVAEQLLNAVADVAQSATSCSICCRA
jgi:hypothetical protein